MHGACEYEENNSTRYRAQYTNCCMSIARILHVTCIEYIVVNTRFQWRIAFTVYAQQATSMCMNKQAFTDAICLRYGWTPERLPSHCPCGEVFTAAHAFSCPKGALPSIRHNQVWDITAQLLTEVCPSVGIEPTLQPLNGESFPLRSTNTEEGARLDIRGQNFWDTSKRSAFFDARVFNSYAPSNSKSTTKACYRRHEREKRREYERRVLEVEHGTFTPLVLSTMQRGMGTFSNCRFPKTGRVNRHKAQPSL